jgi:hypothetical protein
VRPREGRAERVGRWPRRRSRSQEFDNQHGVVNGEYLRHGGGVAGRAVAGRVVAGRPRLGQPAQPVRLGREGLGRGYRLPAAGRRRGRRGRGRLDERLPPVGEPGGQVPVAVLRAGRPQAGHLDAEQRADPGREVSGHGHRPIVTPPVPADRPVTAAGRRRDRRAGV